MVEMTGIKIVDSIAFAEGGIDSRIGAPDLGGFIKYCTGWIMDASPRGWLWSKIVPNGNLHEPTISCSSPITIISNKNKHVDSRPPGQHPITDGNKT